MGFFTQNIGAKKAHQQRKSQEGPHDERDRLVTSRVTIEKKPERLLSIKRKE